MCLEHFRDPFIAEQLAGAVDFALVSLEQEDLPRGSRQAGSERVEMSRHEIRSLQGRDVAGWGRWATSDFSNDPVERKPVLRILRTRNLRTRLIAIADQPDAEGGRGEHHEGVAEVRWIVNARLDSNRDQVDQAAEGVDHLPIELRNSQARHPIRD